MKLLQWKVWQRSYYIQRQLIFEQQENFLSPHSSPQNQWESRRSVPRCSEYCWLYLSTSNRHQVTRVTSGQIPASPPALLVLRNVLSWKCHQRTSHKEEMQTFKQRKNFFSLLLPKIVPGEARFQILGASAWTVTLKIRGRSMGPLTRSKPMPERGSIRVCTQDTENCYLVPTYHPISGVPQKCVSKPHHLHHRKAYPSSYSGVVEKGRSVKSTTERPSPT